MYRKSVSLKTNIKFQNFNYFRPLAKLKIMKLYNNKILEIELKKKTHMGVERKHKNWLEVYLGALKDVSSKNFQNFFLHCKLQSSRLIKNL